ncbi:beta-N-acetylhexosaminidase isoform X2 [Hoplias malabaricus]
MDRFRVLRLMVIFLVVLAFIKFFSSSSNGNVQKTGNFWNENNDFKDNRLDSEEELPKVQEFQEILKPQENKAEEKPVEENNKKQPEPDSKDTQDEDIEIIRVPEKPFTGPLRIVHLDLKGAAPKVSYLKQIFPLFSSLGADGVLMEYEDMFPYEGELELLKSPFAYSMEDIKEIKALANLSNLELIPLVQVFGHLEFVLKHEKFHHLREVAQYPNSLNPMAPGSLKLIKSMVKQILKQHQEVRWFHIGADEVYELGESEDSKRWLEKNGDVGALYLAHVTEVCRMLAEMRPGLKMLFWEDMLRKISVSTMQNSDLKKYAFPMIWSYSPTMNLKDIALLLTKYQESGFSGVWFASAFKGSSAVDQRWTPLKHQLENHLAWVKVINSMNEYPNLPFLGITLTGWQRFEHFIRLCELLPVAIPSLAICLQALKHGSYDEELEKTVHNILGCKIQLEAGVCEGSGAFAGAEVYHMIYKIHTELQSSIENLMTDHFLRGSFSNYQRKYNFANPRNLNHFKNRMKKMLVDWESFLGNFRTEMETIFFPDTVEEWFEENVNEQMDKLRGMVEDVERIYDLNGRPKTLTV